MYFKDPAGNVLEFIARDQAGTASASEFFRPENILRVSEIGIAADDVPALVSDIARETGLPVYGNASPNFTAVGDLGGLLIVVERDHIWLPNSGVPADTRLSKSTSKPTAATTASAPRPIRLSSIRGPER